MDYENTLLGQFHGVLVTGAKAFTQQVNLNSVAYLDEIVIMAPLQPDESHRACFVANKLAAMPSAETRLKAAGVKPLEWIWKRAQVLSRPRSTEKLSVSPWQRAPGWRQAWPSSVQTARTNTPLLSAR